MSYVVKDSNGNYYRFSEDAVHWTDRQSEAERFETKEEAEKLSKHMNAQHSESRVVKLKVCKGKPSLPSINLEEERMKLKAEVDLNKERERHRACEIVEEWIRSISKEFCSINFNHSMNEVKVNFEELPRNGFIDHGSLYDSLCACEDEMREFKEIEPKPGTVFVQESITYVVTDIELIKDVKYIWVKSSDLLHPVSWGNLNYYCVMLKNNKIKILWEPK